MIKKIYKVNDIYFEIELESPREGMLTLPVDWKVPGDYFKNYFLNISNQDFDEDMEIMIPESFDDDWMEACFVQFQKRINLHINKFNRVLPADLECYVAELVLLLSSIGKFTNQPLDEITRQTYFKKILEKMSAALNIPVELKFEP